MKKSALIIGAGGQDGAYLAQFLLQKDYKVYCGVRRTASADHWRFRHLGIERDVELVYLELAEESNVARLVSRIQVDEIYNLAAQSYVGTSFEQAIYTAEIDAVGVCRILEAIRNYSAHTRFYQASTSEMYGKVMEVPQSETTPFYPRSPYGVAKLYGHWITRNYREAYNMFACSGILFNHESPLRGPEFVTRKAVIGLASIRLGRMEILNLGNLDAKRDWGFAGDYVVGMWLMLNAQEADDYVLATGHTRSVREFLNAAATCLDFELEWHGSGESEVGTDRKTGKTVVAVDAAFYRPAEVDLLVGDATKAHQKLGWKPQTSFDQLVSMMVEAEVARLTGPHA
ncbi:MAG: GDP-mannose 4,6-dehydratase [Alphaproteobacteria bacterium]|nr:GDP-mannose 4,6-dehydratase [Alphaproteobacteria bacterium]